MGGEETVKRLYESDYFLMLISVITAVIIWIYVVYEKNPLYETWIRNIPITYINQTQGFETGKLTVIKESTKTIDVKIKGRRTAISSAKLSDINCTVNMADITRGGTYSLPISVNFSADGIELMQKSPYNISITVDEVATQECSITIETSGSVKSGYVVDDSAFTPDAVKLTGPQTLLAKVDRASVTVDLTDKDNDINGLYKIKLYRSDGEELTDDRISKNVDYAEVKFVILQSKTIKIKPVFSQSATSDGKPIQASTVSPDLVTVKGRGEQLKDLTEIKTQVIDVSHISEGGEATVMLDLGSLPEGVAAAESITHNPITVKYTVGAEQKNNDDGKEDLPDENKNEQ